MMEVWVHFLKEFPREGPMVLGALDAASDGRSEAQILGILN